MSPLAAVQGAIPAWTVMKSREQFNSPALPLLTVISASGVDLRNLDEGRAPSDDLSGYRVVHPGDLVINKLWARFGAYGVSTCAGIISPAYWVLTIDAAKFEPRFLHHLLRSDLYKTEIGRLSRNLPPNGFDLSWIQFRTLRLPAMPLHQQRRIADFLDDQVAVLDRAIGLRQHQVALEAERAESLIWEAVSGGILGHPGSVSSVPWIAPLHPDAREQPLGRTLSLQRGVDLTADARLPGRYPVVTTGGIAGHHSVGIAAGPGVVIGRYGTVGSVFWIDTDYWPHNTTLYVKDFKGNLPKYVYYLLRSYPYQRLQARAAVPGVNRNDMHHDLMPWLPVAVQQEAVALCNEVLADRQTVTAAMSRSLTLLVERKQALITAAVTGQFDVTAAKSVA